MGIFKRFFGSRDIDDADQLSLLTVERNFETITVEKSAGRITEAVEQDEHPTSLLSESFFKNEGEKANFLCLEIISGKWAEMGGTRNDAKDFAKVYMSDFSFGSDDMESKIELNSVKFFYRHQLLLMSRKPASDFYRIQQYPPFSTKTLRTFVALLSAYQNHGAAGFSRTFDHIFPVNFSYKKESEPIAIVGDNTGESPESAIAIKIIGPNSGLKELPRWQIGSQAEYWYLCFNYGMKNDSWEFTGHRSLAPIDGKEYSMISIEFRDGRSKDVYFDVTDFRGDFQYER
jgi:hypothetical protein